MGVRSKAKFLCDVKLSITNGPLYDYVMNQIERAKVPVIFNLKTYNSGKITNRVDLVNAGIFCTHTTIRYTIEIDMYNIVKRKTNRVIAQLMRGFRK